MKRVNAIESKIDWLLLVVIIFLPRLWGLDVFLTADEPLFLTQAREFAAGLSSGDWSQTLGIGYPGVTVAWWSAPVVGPAAPEAPASALAAYTAGRAATATATGILLLILYALARILTGRWPALLGVGLLALDPYTLAYSRLLHIAAPLALFMTLAGLSYLLWLAQRRWPWLVLTGLWTGLALLTKSTALLLGPMLGVSLLGWSLSTGRSRDRRWWAVQVGSLLLIALLAAGVFTFFWPAMWTQPAQALGLTFGKLFTDQEAGTGNLGLFWLGRFVQDPGLAFYPVAFLLKATPWLLAGLILNLYFLGLSWSRNRPVSRRLASSQRHDTFYSQDSSSYQHITFSMTLWLFALTYLIFMTIASKKSIRYMLPAFPAFYLLSGLAFDHLRKIVTANGRSSFILSSRLHPLMPILIFVPVALLAVVYHPYYFTYYNPFVLGWRWAPDTLLVGWGEGLDEAARYLSPQTNGPVSAWYEWLFPVFFDGQVEAVVPQENLITAEHTVLYINQVQRDIPGPNIIHYFQTRRRPEHTVRLAGIDYAWVYPGPIAGFRPDPAPQYPLSGDFGGEARLLGYDFHPQPRSGESLIVTLFWRVLSRPPAERFVYVRLVDSLGHIWARADSPPVMGLWPVTRWQPDMLIEDAQELPIPPGTPPGPYRLEVGLYDPDSGQPLPAGGQPIGQGGGLLLGEIDLAWQSIRADAGLPHQTDLRLAPNAHLIGYGDLPATATTGDLLPLELAWRQSGTLFSSWNVPNNLVRFEWRPTASRDPTRPGPEQLDELPLPIEQWGDGAILRSQHEIIVPPALTTGRYDLFVSLHTGSDPAGPAFSPGTIEVTAPPHGFDLPAEARSPEGPAHLAEAITLAGYNLHLTGTGDSPELALDLKLYWQTSAPVTRRYKVFAQLLTAENELIAQADSFPAAGQRPTTGWLPDEIITDAHTLFLPGDVPAGDYRLIAGLYNPLTGERLPVLADNDEPVADAVFVTEISLPSEP